MNFDILYIYRKVRWNALKWSLRSLQHIGHGDVWVVGDKTDYDVNNIVVDRVDRWTYEQGHKFKDANRSFKVAVNEIPKGRKVLLMHDDMYLLPDYKPKKHFKGLLSDYPRGGRREEIFKNSLKFTDTNYGLHYPMPFVNDFEFTFTEPVSIMSFLGSQNHFESVQSDDCKFKTPTLEKIEGLPCFSTYQESDRLLPLMEKLYPN